MDNATHTPGSDKLATRIVEEIKTYAATNDYGTTRLFQEMRVRQMMESWAIVTGSPFDEHAYGAEAVMGYWPPLAAASLRDYDRELDREAPRMK